MLSTWICVLFSVCFFVILMWISNIYLPDDDLFGSDGADSCEGVRSCSPDPKSRSSCCALNPIIRQQLESMSYASVKAPCMPNIASLYVGATVASIRNTIPYRHPQGLATSAATNIPELVLEPSQITIGKNWHFTGEGTLVIKLFYPSQISGFTVIHPPRCQIPAGHEVSAPKDFHVIGTEKWNESEPFLFGNYTYDLKSHSSQTFPVKFCSKEKYQFIEFRFTSNHGNPDYTALYKVQIHGDIGPPSFATDFN